MGKIVVLDENTSNKIAAGEVIERPASVVKELVENSIDAGATSISVEIKNGGVSYIKVTDNGSGIDEDDAEIAFERHATSKIRNSNDLESISTMGFRGEALASIAAVSNVELSSRIPDNDHGTYINIKGGRVIDVKRKGCPVGTTFLIKELFYNTPARFKFLKKDTTEAGYVSDIIGRIALGNPNISIKLVSNNANVIHTPGNNDLQSTIFSVYGKQIAKEVCSIEYKDNLMIVSGFAGNPEIARANRNQQSLFINGRYVKSKIVTAAIDEAYKTFLMKNKFAFIVLNVEINPLLIDINVHPTKMEVRFSNEQEVFRGIYHAVSNALLSKPMLKNVTMVKEPENSYAFDKVDTNDKDYSQQKLDFVNLKKAEDIKTKENIFDNNQNNIKESLILKEEKTDDDFIKKEIETIIKPKEEKDIIEKPFVEPYIVTEVAKKRNEAEFEKPQTLEGNEEDFKINNIPEVPKEKNTEFDTLRDLIYNAKIIGQAFSTYILLQRDNEMFLVDQHAAHERIMYEKLKKKYINNEPLAQMLLAPVVIELTHQEIKFIEEQKELFNKLGFIYENFGNNSVIIRSIPYLTDGSGAKEIFLEIVDKIMRLWNTEIKTVEDESLYLLACKAAIKANKSLNEIEIKAVLESLVNIENPYTCPHGRPTLVKITKYEFEKMFKRVL